jgi:hypothetical protein
MSKTATTKTGEDAWKGIPESCPCKTCNHAVKQAFEIAQEGKKTVLTQVFCGRLGGNAVSYSHMVACSSFAGAVSMAVKQ